VVYLSLHACGSTLPDSTMGTEAKLPLASENFGSWDLSPPWLPGDTRRIATLVSSRESSYHNKHRHDVIRRMEGVHDVSVTPSLYHPSPTFKWLTSVH